MDRRTLLATVGSVGVLGVGGHTLTTATDPGPETDERRVRLESVDSALENHQFRFEVEVLESRITGSHTARVTITTTNEGPQREITIGTRRDCRILNRSDGSSIPRGAFLWRPHRTEHFERDGEKWRPTNVNSDGIAFGDYPCQATVLDTGESLQSEYELWDDHTEAGYLPPDTYRWERPLSVWEYPDPDYADSPEPTLTWGFSLSVEVPD